MNRSPALPADKRNTRVVVAIPARNEAGTIETVLRNIASARSELPDLQIVVVDGGSLDATRQIVTRLAAELPCIHLAKQTLGLGPAVNLVARQWAGRADVLVRCDAHAAYPRHFVQRLVETLQRTGATSVVVPMDSVGHGCFQKAVAWVSDTAVGSGGAAHRGGRSSGFVDHGHHAAFWLARFLEAGGYAEDFTHNEDAELDCRLRAAGGTIYLDCAARIEYHPRATARALARQYFHYGCGRSRTMRKHPRSIRLRQLMVPAHTAFSLGSLLVAFATGQWIALAWPLIYAGILSCTSLALAMRKRAWCGLWAGPAALIMHTAWAAGFFWGILLIREPAWKPARTHLAESR